MTTDQPYDAAAQALYRSRVRASILGGAIGDALGGPIEFWPLDRIRRELPDGVRLFVPERTGSGDVFGRITDDTQMTLFTMEGMIRASVRSDRGTGFTLDAVHHAYDRWYDTQTMPGPDGQRDGWLINEQWLYSPRAPGMTCMSALQEARAGERTPPSFGHQARNDSKGCGGVMRSAPFGLVPPWSPFTMDERFAMAAEAAGFTHGHPTGKLASGALAVLIAALVQGEPLGQAVNTTLAQLRRHDHHDETTRAIEAAVAASVRPASAAVLESLGEGWVAEEALAMAIYAALVHAGPHEMLDALALSVTHGGDSDSTGAICGNILGALHGEAALPPELTFEVEGRGAIVELVDDFSYEFTAAARLHDPNGGGNPRWQQRYPGW